MTFKQHIPVLFLIALLLTGCKLPPDALAKNPNGATYTLLNNWPHLPSGFVLGNPSGIGVDTSQNLVVFYRGSREWPLLWPFPKTAVKSNTIMVINGRSGEILQSWGAGMFIMPHGITVDKQNNIWVIDCGLHQVLKFTHEGKLLFKVGQAGVPGKDSVHFNKPTGVAVAGDGSFYVSDGYGNSRVVKFSAQGNYLFEWGTKGSKPAQFNIPHAITLDDEGNVYVADRENSRIEVFNSYGKFLSEWKNKDFGKIYSVTFNPVDKTLVAVDYVTNYIHPAGSDVIVLDKRGNIIARFGRSGLYSGPVSRYHAIAVDNSGNIYVGDILNNSLQKFTKVTR